MNVLVICSDTFRADYLGCYGNDWIETSNLDALAAGGIVFEQAYAEGMPTLPARRVYFTGRNLFPRWEIIPHKGDHLSFQPAWHAIPDEEETVAELLSETGTTCGFISDVLHYFKPTGNFHRGFDSFQFIRGQTVDRYRTGPRDALSRAAWAGESPGEFRVSSLHTGERKYLLNVSERRREEDYFAPQVMRTASRWIEDNAENQPFFLWVDCFDPHEPWDPPLYYADRYFDAYHDPRLIFAPGVKSEQFSEEEMKRVRALYAGEVVMVDKWVGRVLQRLEDLGLDETTAVIFTSDHGTLLGELDTVHKQPWGLVQPETRLPLIVRLPGGRMAGARVDEYVSAVDIAPTIMSLLDQPPTNEMQGGDLIDVAAGTEKGRDEIISAYGPYASIRTRTHNYVAPYKDVAGTPWKDNPQPPRLFALDETFKEVEDVSKERPDLAEALQDRLDRIVES